MNVKEKVLAKIDGMDEVQIKKVEDYMNFLQLQGKRMPQIPNGKKDPILNIGKNPTNVGTEDASENLDDYLY